MGILIAMSDDESNDHKLCSERCAFRTVMDSELDVLDARMNDYTAR